MDPLMPPPIRRIHAERQPTMVDPPPRSENGSGHGSGLTSGRAPAAVRARPAQSPSA